MTPAEMVTNIRDQLVEATPGFYTDNELRTYLSYAETIMSNEIGTIQTSQTVSTSGNVREYVRPSGAIEIIRVTWDECKLVKMASVNGLDYSEGTAYGGTATVGNPVYYYEMGEVIGLSPIPTDTKNLKIWYTKNPDPITSTSTSFSVPQQFVNYLADYVLYRCSIKDDNASKSSLYLSIWNDNIRKAKSAYKARESRNLIYTVKDSSAVDEF